MTTQEVLLALVTVGGSVLARCLRPLWPRSPTGQRRSPDTCTAGDERCSERGGGCVPSGRAASAEPWKDSHESNTL